MPVSEAKKKLQADRKSQGLCIQCGERSDGKTRCPICRNKAKSSRQKSAAKKKAAGICQVAGCTRAAMTGKTVCKPCSQRASEYASERYYRNKEQGVCRECGEESNGRSRCPTCAIRYAKSRAVWYDEKKRDGICVGCGAREASPGVVLCVECNEKHKTRSKRRWDDLKSAAFAYYGGAVCQGCGEDEEAILEIDHINGGGTQHRKDIGQSNMYVWLRDNGYPAGYRVLCPTCNKKAHRQIPLPSET